MAQIQTQTGTAGIHGSIEPWTAAHRRQIEAFIRQQRLRAGIRAKDIPPWADADLEDIDASYDLTGGRFLVVHDHQGEIIATAGLARCGSAQAEIRKFYVDQVATGRGLGKTLLSELELVARRNGYASIRVKTFPHLKAAICLYGSLGYALTKKRIAGEPEVIVLEKALGFPQSERAGRMVALRETPSWPSANRRMREATDVVARVCDQRPLAGEHQAQIHSLDGVHAPQLWDRYFQSYDRVVAFSTGYRQAINWSESALPFNGLIADYGAGTGNFSAAVQAAGPDRQMALLDSCQRGLSSARAKLEAVSDRRHDSILINADLRAVDVRLQGRVTGAIMNNVLYTFDRASKVMVLKRVFDDLKPGGCFVLNDPLPMAQTKENLKDFLTEIVASACHNNSPMTLSDVALVAAVNLSVLTAKSPPFSTEADLEALVTQVGFEVIDRAKIYYGRASSLVLRKP